MNIKKWVWCLHCERAFEVHLSREPRVVDGEVESAIEFTVDFEMQLGITQAGQVYAECPYEDCDGSLLDFWWWEEYRVHHPEAAEWPSTNQVYPHN